MFKGFSRGFGWKDLQFLRYPQKVTTPTWNRPSGGNPPQGTSTHNDPELDARIVVEKAKAGAGYAITQLFFDAARWVELVDRVRSRGSDIPIIPGIMPLTVITQIERFAALADCELPADFVAQLRAADNPAEVRRIGLERAERMCHELLEAGAPGLQFFTQNRWQATSEVISRLPWNRSRHASSSVGLPA